MTNKISFNISALLTLLWFCSLQTFSQDIYLQREQKASPQVKQRLTALRNRIQQRKLKFQVGYTFPAEKGVTNLMGGKKPNISASAARKQNTLALQLTQIDNQARLANKVPSLKIACSSTLKKWDWRTERKVTPVRRQQCGNCWAYAAVAPLESSFLIQNNKTIDASEQYIVSNNDNSAGKCTGGETRLAMEFLATNGTTPESVLPDSGTNGTADPNLDPIYSALTWGWVNADNPGTPSIENIKQSICENGPVATWIDAGGSFGFYAGGIYDDDDDKEAGHVVGGHFVTIIGWDEANGAWLIKNSWGTTWGETAGFGNERGYGWVKYGTHQIGSYPSWIKARGVSYPLPTRYYELMPPKRPLLQPATNLINTQKRGIAKPQ